MGKKAIIITVVEEPGIPDLQHSISSLKRQSDYSKLQSICIFGRVSEKSMRFIDSEFDIRIPFANTDVWMKYKSLISNSEHPFGKWAKLFLIREVLIKNFQSDIGFLYFDPDVLFQSDIDYFFTLPNGKAYFGHELRFTNHFHKPNARYKVLAQIGKSDIVQNHYLPEVNTGFIVGKTEDILTTLDAFEEFCDLLGYLDLLGQGKMPGKKSWHDQDMFRAFLASEIRHSIACLDLDEVLTTNSIASHVVRREAQSGNYVTLWDVKPKVLHFAGGSKRQIVGGGPSFFARYTKLWKRLMVKIVKIQWR